MTPTGTSAGAVGDRTVREHGNAKTGPSFVEIDGVDAVYQIASDGVGGEWFENGLDPSGFGLVRVDEPTHGTRVFAHPYDGLSVLAPSADHTAMWFGSADQAVVGNINLQTHTIKLRRVSDGVSGIVAAPDNYIWFTLPTLKKIGRLDPSTFSVDYYTTHNYVAQAVVLGPDGAVFCPDLSQAQCASQRAR